MEASCIRAQHGGQVLLDSQRNGAVLITEDEEAGDVVPGLILDDISVHTSRLVLQGSDGLALSLSIHIVVEDVLRCVSVYIVTLLYVSVIQFFGPGL